MKMSSYLESKKIAISLYAKADLLSQSQLLKPWNYKKKSNYCKTNREINQ